MTAYVTDRSVLLRSFPTAYLAWLPVPHRGDTTEHPATKVLEEWREVFLYLLHRIPSILEGLLDVPP